MKFRIAAVVVVPAVFVLWIFAGPSSLGGGATYVSTYGISMEPAFQAGDLAVVRPATDFAVGDVATYRSGEVNALVMHRIVAVEGDRYTFQGDNNAWLDAPRPTRQQLHGKVVFRIPRGGVWLGRATSAPALGALGLILMTTGGTTAAIARKRRRKKAKAVKPQKLAFSTLTFAPSAQRAAVALGAVAVCLAAAVVVTWNQIPADDQPAERGPAPSMTFGYRATAPQSPAYDSKIVTEPQPIFRNVVDDVDVLFTYASATEVSATVDVAVELSTANGWHSSLSLVEPATFAGTTYRGSVKLDLSHLQRRADAAAEAIGEAAAGDVTVKVVPSITSDDRAEFLPAVTFTLTPEALRLAEPGTALTVQSASAAPTASVGATSHPDLFGWPIPPRTTRIALAAALALTIAAAVLAVAATRRGGDVDEVSTFQRKYSQVLLDVEPMVLPAGGRVIDVPNIAQLTRLAEHYGLFVMHWHRGELHTYMVLDETQTYRYRHGAKSMSEGSTRVRVSG